MKEKTYSSTSWTARLNYKISTEVKDEVSSNLPINISEFNQRIETWTYPSTLKRNFSKFGSPNFRSWRSITIFQINYKSLTETPMMKLQTELNANNEEKKTVRSIKYQIKVKELKNMESKTDKTLIENCKRKSK